MALQTTAIKNALATAYAAAITHIGLATTAPGASRGTEVSGGSPAYARKAANAGSASGGSVAFAPAAFDVPAGVTVVGINMENALTAGTYQDGATVTSQPFASQGTYTVVPTYTQT
jgi:plastocyanin